MFQRLGIGLGVLSLLLAGALGAAANPYFVTDLGGISGDTLSVATGINNSGQVVGYSDAGNPKYAHGFFYSGGTFQQLGGFGGTANIPYAVNDSGQVTGFARNTSGGGGTYGMPQAYVTAANGGALTNLTTVTGGPEATNSSIGYAISNNGQVGGMGYFPDNGGDSTQVSVPFVYNGSSVTELPLDASLISSGDSGAVGSQCNGINNSGVAVGAASFQPPMSGGTPPTPGTLAVLYKNGVEYNLGFLGGSGTLLFGPPSSAQAINASGQVAGTTYNMATGQMEAFLWNPTVQNGTSGTMTGLGLLTSGGAGWFSAGPESDAEAINSAGVVVGYSNIDTTSSVTHGFIYSGGAMTDVNTLLVPAAAGWVINKATGINDSGVIIGDATNSAGATQAVLLTPAVSGDANLDGKVDINDLTIVLAHYNATGATWSAGDFVGDGRVDINDLTIVLANYNKTMGAAAAGAPSAVPEPCTLALLLAAGLLALAVCGRRNWR
jgi:probable HAF family extracellular repeat protein